MATWRGLKAVRGYRSERERERIGESLKLARTVGRGLELLGYEGPMSA